MPALQVKDCPASVYEQLRACADEENRSIAQQTLTIIQDFPAARERGTQRSAPKDITPCLFGRNRHG